MSQAALRHISELASCLMHQHLWLHAPTLACTCWPRSLAALLAWPGALVCMFDM